MEPAHSETGDCRVEPPASILAARLSMSHLVPLLEFNHGVLEYCAKSELHPRCGVGMLEVVLPKTLG